MPSISQQHIRLLKKAGIIALVEGIKAVPGVGWMIAGTTSGIGTILQETIETPPPNQVYKIIQQLIEDYRQFLSREEKRYLNNNIFEVALVVTLDILTTFELSDEKMVSEANLNASRAAKLTLQQATETLSSLLDSDTRALVERLIEDYYSILLSRKDILSKVEVEAVKTILTKLSDFEHKLHLQFTAILDNQEKLLSLERVKAWRQRSAGPYEATIIHGD